MLISHWTATVRDRRWAPGPSHAAAQNVLDHRSCLEPKLQLFERAHGRGGSVVGGSRPRVRQGERRHWANAAV